MQFLLMSRKILAKHLSVSHYTGNDDTEGKKDEREKKKINLVRYTKSYSVRDVYCIQYRSIKHTRV